MKLAQAVEASQEQAVYRVVGALRILIQYKQQQFRVLVQCWHRRRWILTNAASGVLYLNGVWRDMDGSWVVNGCDITALEHIALCFPSSYQHLFVPDSDDWQVLRGRKGAG